MINLKSSINNISQTTTQIFHFVGGEKRTFHGIISSEIKEGEMLKLKLIDGRLLIINKKNLLMTEVFSESIDEVQDKKPYNDSINQKEDQ